MAFQTVPANGPCYSSRTPELLVEPLSPHLSPFAFMLPALLLPTLLLPTYLLPTYPLPALLFPTLLFPTLLLSTFFFPLDNYFLPFHLTTTTGPVNFFLLRLKQSNSSLHVSTQTLSGEKLLPHPDACLKFVLGRDFVGHQSRLQRTRPFLPFLGN